MIDDPIVEEVHRIRAERLAECDDDLDKYMDRLKEREAEAQERLIQSVEELRARRYPSSFVRKRGLR